LTRPIGFAQGKLLKRRSSMVLHAFPFSSPAPERRARFWRVYGIAEAMP
jgi:hypothetical protein